MTCYQEVPISEKTVQFCYVDRCEQERQTQHDGRRAHFRPCQLNASFLASLSTGSAYRPTTCGRPDRPSRCGLWCAPIVKHMAVTRAALLDEVHRVSQLDAARLDDELQTLFLSEARTALRFVPGGTLESLLPELKALLRLIFFLNTVAQHKPSPGNAFQNLRYASARSGAPLSRWQRAVHFALEVALPYAWARLRRRTSGGDWARRRRGTWRLLNAAEAAARLGALANLAAFFRAGRYRSLADRAARARLRYARPARDVPPAFEFVNSQLVWQGVAEGALLLAPLLAAPGALARSSLGRRVLGAIGVRGAAAAEDGRGVTRCAECGAGDVVMPHRVLPCKHLFCYVCLAAALERSPALVCRACGAGVHGLERVKFG